MRFIDRTILTSMPKCKKISTPWYFAPRTIAAFLSVGLAGAASAAPLVSQVPSTVNHRAAATITGSGFGTKATGVPVVWDDASGSGILSKWSGAWPDASPTATYNTAYRTPIRSIGLPHSNITRYIAGAHGDNVGSDAGYNVILYKNRVISSYPAFTYASWYQRSDDNWVFGIGSPGDDNYKVFDYSNGTSPYDLPNNWYIEYNARPTSRTSGPDWHLNDDTTSLVTPDNNGHSWFWGGAVNPMGGTWTKIEVEAKYTNQTNGYVKLWENGVLKISYAGRTDSMAGTSRSEGIGGYARAYGNSNNWRYFADAYLDYCACRVVLANNAVLANATIVETQVPTSWSNTSISVTVNLGKFTKGQTAYIFVVDPTGAPNAAGIPTTVGDGALSRPLNLRVL